MSELSDPAAEAPAPRPDADSSSSDAASRERHPPVLARRWVVVASLTGLASLAQAAQYVLPFLWGVSASRGAFYCVRTRFDISEDYFGLLVG